MFIVVLLAIAASPSRQALDRFIHELDQKIAAHPNSTALIARREQALKERELALDAAEEPSSGPATQPMFAPQPPVIVQARASQPRQQAPMAAVELWVQPIGTTLYAITLQGHLSLGATFTVAPDWQVVIGGAATIGRINSPDSSASAWQAWLSVAPVRLFHQPGAGSGFFIGPKLAFSILNTQELGWETCSAGCKVIGWHREPPTTQFGMELGLEMGIRVQAGHFAFTIMPPSPTIGFATNSTGGIFSTALMGIYGGMPTRGAVGFTWSLDLNIVRFGVAF